MGLSPARTDSRRRFLCFACSLRTRARRMASRLPDKGLLMCASQDLMCCWIHRQHGLPEQATTAIIADRSQTAGLGMISVIKVCGILHQQHHRQGLHLTARLLIMRLHQLLKGDIGLCQANDTLP